jgi:hypothetical protein
VGWYIGTGSLFSVTFQTEVRVAFRAALALAAASGVCLAAAGCGSGSDGDPLASMTANQVVTKALGDLKSAPSQCVLPG